MLFKFHTVYSKLAMIDQVDSTTSALYRQLAQEVLASTEIDLAIRQAIAERLNQANQLLARETAGSEDSY